jgi:hypothetical protein
VSDTENPSKPPSSRPYLPPPPGTQEETMHVNVPRSVPPPASLLSLIPEADELASPAAAPGETLRAVLTLLLFSLLTAGGYLAYRAAF